ncbi:MFS transporter [Streptomyces sp. KL116D]|uniref:MFS transporter n=1 Tax=Streptomyces sp. KL116D TaxID=3045152 RepID=UPI0035565F14
MTATLLAGAVSTPIMGRLGDLAGKRRMLLTSLAIMVVGSLVCGFIGQPARDDRRPCAAGLAMGAIPLGIGLMRDMLPREKLGSAMALMSSSIGVGGGLALPLAALVAQHADWHALFFGAADSASGRSSSPWSSSRRAAARAGHVRRGRRPRPPLGLVLFLLPITKGSDWGWGRAPRSACVTPRRSSCSSAGARWSCA